MSGHRRQLRPDQLRDLEGRRDRHGRSAGARAGQAQGDDQRGRPRLHRDADDRRRCRSDRAKPAAAQQPVARAACRSTSPRRSPGSPARPRPASTATSSASAARACWGPDGDAHARQLAQHPAALRPRRGADDPRRLAAAVRPRRRRRDPRDRARACDGVARRPRATVAAYARVCGFALRDQPARPPTRTCSPSRCTWR